MSVVSCYLRRLIVINSSLITPTIINIKLSNIQEKWKQQTLDQTVIKPLSSFLTIINHWLKKPDINRNSVMISRGRGSSSIVYKVSKLMPSTQRSEPTLEWMIWC